MTTPAYRHLRGYSLDPGFSTRLDTAGINEVVYQVPFEPVEPGPVGEYLEVIDFDPATGCWYEPVDLTDDHVASQRGLAPSEGNPQFHQQFVYAVAMKTIRHFERALGRKILWYPRVRQRSARDPRTAGALVDEYVQRLRIHPHATRDANAYYDPEKTALLFGYFTAADQIQGTNYPGGLVFTCLSPDIVAHETTHAILDSIHHRYLDDTNPDVAAFHEGFADIVALLQRFTFRELVEDRLAAAAGRLDEQSFILGALATQFGEALPGHRGALRSMIGGEGKDGKWHPKVPDPSDYSTHLEPHERGAVLVATIFDAFQRVYAYRTRDLFRLASGGTGILPKGAISSDLVARLADEAREIAEHLLHICIRALDYSPPNDITFGSYLRALISADLDIAPEDERGYRVALIEAFRARGIFPSRVHTLSEESLLWRRPEFTLDESNAVKWIAKEMRPDIQKLVDTSDRKALADLSSRARAKLHALFTQEQHFLGAAAWERFLNKLGMTSRPVSQLFGRASSSVRFLDKGKPTTDHVPPIEVHTIRPAFRAGREGRQIEQVVVTLTQRVSVDLGDGREQSMTFRGGCTLILSLGRLGEIEAKNLTADVLVDHVVIKNIKSHERFKEQEAYMKGESHGLPPGVSPYEGDARPARIDFNLLHQP